MLKKESIKVEKSKYFPDIYAGWFNQQIDGNKGFTGWEAGVSLPGLAVRRYDEVRAFHESVIRNRRDYLAGELETARQRVAGREKEKEILEGINKHGIGPMGYGGNTTSLDVFIEMEPCHIASLPCAVNVNCHSARHKEAVI